MSLKRIAVNVTATYVQNAVSIVVGLFAARWVYLALGEERFGLFSLVGSLIAFVGIFNSLMTNSNARFFAIAIGEGRRSGAEAGKTELRKWFNTAFSVHVAMAVTLCLLMYPVGLYFIRNKLSIPDGLFASSVWVFRISIVATFFAILNIPFHSLYTAKQLIFVRNAFGILQTLLCAAEGWWLLHYSGDRLVAHSAVTSLILIGLYVGMAALAFRSFPECRLRFSDWYDRGRLKALFSYSSFTLFGSLGGLLSGPGVNIVLNMFFGPSINAVLGIGRQVSSKTNMLSEAVVTAVSPEVTSRVGADDMKRAQSLGLDICYLSAVISILVFVPILMWLPELLVLWLKTPPVGAAAVSMIMILESIILKVTIGYQMMIHASGKIKAYQMVLGTLNMSCIGILWVLLKLGYAPILALAIAWLLPRSLLSMGRLLFARKILGMPIRLFLKSVLSPTFLLAVISVSVCFSVRILSEGRGVLGLLPALGLNFVVVLAGVMLIDAWCGGRRFASLMSKFLVLILDKLFVIQEKHQIPRKVVNRMFSVYERSRKRKILTRVQDVELLPRVKWGDGVSPLPANDGFHVKDETCPEVSGLKRISWLAHFNYYLPVKAAAESQKKRIDFGGNRMSIHSDERVPRRWVFLHRCDSPGLTYALDFDVQIQGDFTELQFAFNYLHIVKRLRFLVIDNEKLCFEVVDKGFFFRELRTVPCKLEHHRWYHIRIEVIGNAYAFFVDGERMLAVSYPSQPEPGTCALILFERSAERSISCEIKDAGLQEGCLQSR
jgi:O-antigen/teichoic acid export membrane protein